MARPTKEEEKAVEKYVNNVRRRKMEKILKDYSKQLKKATGWVPDPTEMTSWVPKGNDPLKIYKGNTDHWAKIRLQGDRTLARRHLAQSPSGSQAAEPATLDEKYERQADEMRCLEEKTFHELIKDCLRPDLPGTLSLGQGRPRHKLPDNKFHREEVEHEDYKYWYSDRLTLKPTVPKKSRKDS